MLNSVSSSYGRDLYTALGCSFCQAVQLAFLHVDNLNDSDHGPKQDYQDFKIFVTTYLNCRHTLYKAESHLLI